MDQTEVETVVRLRAADVRDLFPAAAADDVDARVCILCAATLKDKTHNLTRHLERRHAAALLQLLGQRAAAAAAAAAAPGTASTPKKARARSSNKAAAVAASPAASKRAAGSKRRHDTSLESDTDSDDTVAAAAAKQEEQSGRAESARRALVRWLALEQLPISLVESDGFRAFTSALNGRFGSMAGGDVQRVLVDMQRGADAAPSPKPQPQDDQVSETLQPPPGDHSPAIVATRALVATARTHDDATRVQFQQLPCGVLPSGCTRVRVRAALASHWDARACRGELCGRRGVLGRALVGVVAQTHDESPNTAREQERVVLGAARLRLGAASSSGRGGDADPRPEYFGVDSARGALTEFADVPEASLYSLPSSLPDDVALLTIDVALMLRIADELKRRGTTRLAIVADGVAGCLATLLARYVHQELGLTREDIRVVGIDSLDSKLETQLALYATLDDTQSSATAGSLDTAPLVIDMCASDASAELAIRLTEPMGTLLMLDRQRLEAASSVLAMDMNAVVVNELEMVAIGDYYSDIDGEPEDSSPTVIDDAIAYLEKQEQKGCAVELRVLLSMPVALDGALDELRERPLEAFHTQYLHVEIPTADT